MGRKNTGKPNGRPKVIWTESQFKDFEKLCAMQCPLLEICGWFDVSDVTLYRIIRENYGGTFSEIYARFSAKGKVSVRRRIFMSATSEDPEKYDFRAAKWLSTQHLGMSEKIEQTIDAQVEVDVTYVTEWGVLPDKKETK